MKKFTHCILTLVILALILAFGEGCTKQAKKARYLARGNRDFEAGQYDKAEIEYLTVLKIPPPEPTALARLGLMYNNQGKRLQSLVYLREAVKLAPDNIPARLKLAATYIWFRQLKPAREQLSTVLQKQPDNTDALLLLAESSVTPELMRETQQVIEKFPAKAVEKPEYHLAQATLHFRQNHLDKAEGEYHLALARDSKSSLAYLGLSDIYILRGDLKQAESTLKSAVAVAPLRSPVRLRYAGFQLRLGQGQAAKAAIDDLLQKVPDYIPGWVFLAETAASEGRNADCVALVKKILARDRSNFEALMLNGNLMLATGDGTNAIGQFERLISIYGPTAQSEYSLALAQLAAKQEAKAMASLNQALTADTNFLQALLLQADLNIRDGNPAAAVAPLVRVIKQQPQFSEPYMLLGKAYLTQRRPDDAVRVYRDMQTVFTNQAEVPFAIGSVLLQEGKPREAREAFEASLKLSPNFLPSVEQLVDLDLTAKLGQAAMDRVQKLIDSNPRSALLWVLKGKIYVAKVFSELREASQTNTDRTRELQLSDVPSTTEAVSQAEAALLKAIDLDPSLPSAYQLLAKLYVWSNKQQEALKSLSTLAAKTNNAAIFTQIGVIQEQLHDYAAASTAYERALDVNPDHFEALNNLANLCAERMGKLDRALELAEKAARLQPNNSYGADTLGWIIHRRGEYPRALSLIQESAAKLPNEPEIQYHLGMAHYMMAEEEPARLALEQAVHSNKDFPGKSAAGAALATLAIDPSTAGTDARDLLDKRLKELPNDPFALQRLAAIQERDGAFIKAAKTYETLSTAYPQNARLRVQLARLYDEHLNEPIKAFDLAKEAHKLAPEDGQISYLLGRLAFKNKDYKWAASLLQESARKLPNDPAVLYDLAWSYFSLGQLPEAQSTMRQVPETGESVSRKEAAKQFIDLTTAASDPSRAQDESERAQRLLSSTPDYVPALLVCARVRESESKYSEAARLYEKTLAQYPTFLPSMKNLALLYFGKLKNDQKAYDFATKAREAFPDDPEIAKTLGVLSYRRKEYSRSAQLLEQSVRQRADDAEIFYFLGMARYRLNQRIQSKEKLQRALALNSAAEFAEEAKRILQELK